ncbi:hypothetical protein PTKIN_Ptkin16aG0493400 [Pterospermum kingtungense]
MELNHFSHEHPLVFFEEQRNENEKVYCSGCGERLSGPTFSCVECRFHLHKQCAEAPSQMNHPFHLNHSLSLLKSHPYKEDVNSKHGGYYCSVCNYVAHVNCAIQDYKWYMFEENVEDTSALIPYSIIKETKEGENMVATEIKHFSHDHNLVLSNDTSDDKYCDGCVLSIFTCYYGCSECGFFLHKSCAELPRKMHLCFHVHPKLRSLTVDRIFQCCFCKYESNGFAYTCHICDGHYCLRCALVSDNPKCEGHEHRLPWHKYKALCNACGGSLERPFRCKSCNFALHLSCLALPLTARHKSDEHPYKLTYHDNKNYPESNYCDICEEERNPTHWFYTVQFATLQLIQNVLLEKCHRCGDRCLDLALECKTTGCSYIVHWECIKPRGL